MNAKKGGDAYYRLWSRMTTGLQFDSPALPEVADISLNTQDVLNFSQYDGDVLADVSASALADLDDKTGWLNISTMAS